MSAPTKPPPPYQRIALLLLRTCQPPLLMLAALMFTDAPNALAGAAAGLHLLSHAERQIARATMAAVALTIFSAWLPMPAACLLAGMYATEALLADTMRMRVARLFAAALCLQIILFILIKTPAPLFSLYQLAVALILVVAAYSCAGLQPGKRMPALDPMLCALAFFLFLSFALAVAWLAVQLNSYTLAISGVTAVYGAVLAAVSLLIGPLFREGQGYESTAQAFALDVPLEKWIDIMSGIAGREQNAGDFLTAAAHRMLKELPGVIGIEWRADGKTEKLGGGKMSMHVSCPPLYIIFYRRRLATPWTWFGHYLVCRVVSEYYLSKQREEEQRARNLLYAVHQTGARITHDIKNILHALSAMATTDNADLLRRHIPALRTRLETALGKLRAPDDDNKLMPAAAWWDEAKFRHAQTHGQRVQFHDNPTQLTETMLPSTLFDRALDNFIENARRKHSHASQTSHNNAAPLQQTTDGENNACSIDATLSADTKGTVLQVTDNGDAVDPQMVKKLFASPVASADGFGVALYQLAEEAARADYQIILENNSPGQVTFSLLPAATDEPLR